MLYGAASRGALAARRGGRHGTHTRCDGNEVHCTAAEGFKTNLVEASWHGLERRIAQAGKGTRSGTRSARGGEAHPRWGQASVGHVVPSGRSPPLQRSLVSEGTEIDEARTTERTGAEGTGRWRLIGRRCSKRRKANRSGSSSGFGSGLGGGRAPRRDRTEFRTSCWKRGRRAQPRPWSECWMIWRRADVIHRASAERGEWTRRTKGSEQPGQRRRWRRRLRSPSRRRSAPRRTLRSGDSLRAATLPPTSSMWARTPASSRRLPRREDRQLCCFLTRLQPSVGFARLPHRRGAPQDSRQASWLWWRRSAPTTSSCGKGRRCGRSASPHPA